MTAANGGSQVFQRQSCVGPVRYVGHEDLNADLARMATAVDAAGASAAFLNAASPGLVTAFQPNAFYSSHAEYVAAVGDAMQVEYEAIVDAGFQLQLDCPDLAMARHTGFQDLTDDEFVGACRAARRGAQPCDATDRPGPHADAPVLGQLRGPARS